MIPSSERSRACEISERLDRAWRAAKSAAAPHLRAERKLRRVPAHRLGVEHPRAATYLYREVRSQIVSVPDSLSLPARVGCNPSATATRNPGCTGLDCIQATIS